MNAGAIAIVLTATWDDNQYAWTSPVIVGLGIAGLVRWGLFGFAETRAIDSILSWTILTSRVFIVSAFVGMLVVSDMIGVLSYLSTYPQMVYGYPATTSGLLPVPITARILISSTPSGVLVSCADHYKIYPVAGPLVAADVAFWLFRLSTMSPVWQTSTAAFLMGASIGLFLQLPITVVQNALPAKHLGTATSGDNFFHEVSTSLGASLIDAAFSSGLTSNLTDRVGALARSANSAVLGGLARFKDADTSSPTPALVNQLPTTLHGTAAGSYTDALLPIFGWMISLFVVTSVVAFFLPKVFLSQKTATEQVVGAEVEDELSGPTSSQEPDSAPQQTERESAEPAMAVDAE